MTATRPRLALLTPDCLWPRDAERFVAAKVLPEDVQRHVEGCQRCRLLLQAITPDEKKIAAFVETASRVWDEAKATDA